MIKLAFIAYLSEWREHEHCMGNGLNTDSAVKAPFKIWTFHLDQPNDRYKALNRSWQQARDKQDLQELFAAMRDDDDEYQHDADPPIGSAALAETFKIDLQQELQKAEILWSQKYGKDKAG